MGAETTGRVRVGIATAAVAVAAGCGGQAAGVAAPTASTQASPGAVSVRPAVAAGAGLDRATLVTTANDAGDLVISRAGAAGAEFYFQPHGGRPSRLTDEGVTIEPRLLNNAGQVVGIAEDPSGRQPPRLVRWQNGASTVLPVSGDQIIPEDLNDRGQVTAITVTHRPGGARDVHAYLLDGGSAVDLGVPPDSNEPNLFLNESGQVAGLTSGDARSGWRGFLWDRGTVTTFDTGAATHPVVMGLSDQGQVAGLVWDDQASPSGAAPAFRPAFRWERGVLSLLDSGAGAGPVRINAAGEVAAVALTGPGASREVVVWAAAKDAAPTRVARADADAVVGIDDRGDVLVSATTGATASPGGYLWHRGTTESLGTLGGLAADPKALTATGLVVGASTSADNRWHAAVWPLKA